MYRGFKKRGQNENHLIFYCTEMTMVNVTGLF